MHVSLSKKLDASGASIAVIDDGVGMGPADLKRHWFIGSSNKRDKKYVAPLGRSPIGKFGIGKLATYVLAQRLTHVTRQSSAFYAVTMNYAEIPGGEELVPAKNKRDRVSLSLRTLTELQAKQILAPWNDGTIKLFGSGSARNWTCAIMTTLKPMALDLRVGRLKWVLSTAMPLRDDFVIYLDGQPIAASKEKGRLQRWTLGKDVKELPHVRVSATVDKATPVNSVWHYGLKNDEIGKIYGYFEIYNRLLTSGKSRDIERSYGFFVYVNGRLVNVDDEYFDIDSNLLKHGAFARFRMVAHIDSLDDELRSTREDVREGAAYVTARRVLQDCFNIARVELEHRAEGDSEGPGLLERFSATSATLTAQPIVALVARAMKGDVRPRLTRYPTNLTASRRDEFLAALESRIGDTTFFRETKLEELSYERGICEYDAESGNLVINASHPFVANFLDDYGDSARSIPLKLFAMSEVVLEAQLYQLLTDGRRIADLVDRRDRVLRQLARSSGTRNAAMIAAALRDAKSDEKQLERELVAAFDRLGFDAIPIGGKDAPDGIAYAPLAGGSDGAKGYRVTLEAKSKRKAGAKVSAATVNASRLARHRKDHEAQHAFLIGPSFPTTKGASSAIAREIAEDRKTTGCTITLANVDDFADLVAIAPKKRVDLKVMKALFESCSLPEDVARFVQTLAKKTIAAPPYAEILETIWEIQRDEPDEPVAYQAVSTLLRTGGRGIRLNSTEVRQHCVALTQMAPQYINADDNAVELNIKAERVMHLVDVYPSIPAAEEDREEPANSSVSRRKKTTFRRKATTTVKKVAKYRKKLRR